MTNNHSLPPEPALPAGVQNLLDLYSLEAKLIDNTGTLISAYWRVSIKSSSPIRMIRRRFLMATSASLEEWVMSIERLYETLQE